MTATNRVLSGVLGLGWLPVLAAACAQPIDVAGIEFLTPTDGGMRLVRGQADASQADASIALDGGDDTLSISVLGRPVRDWSFELAPWPLESTLPEFFAGAAEGKDAKVTISGQEARLLLELREAYMDAAYGPGGGRIGVEDLEGNRYAVVLPGSSAL